MKNLRKVVIILMATTFMFVSFTACEITSSDDGIGVICTTQTEDCSIIDDTYIGTFDYDVCTNGIDTAYLEYDGNTNDCDGIDVKAGDCDSAIALTAGHATADCLLLQVEK